MRTNLPALCSLVLSTGFTLTACVTEQADAPAPRIIAGGGIGDGPIDGVVNLYVVDDVTRKPIEGARVTVGDVDGKTDATGLFVAHGVTGAQTIAATAGGYESALWVGVDGANTTIDLTPAPAPAPASANLSGQITGFAGITVAANHIKGALVGYSNSDVADAATNNLPTAGNANACQGTTTCAFTVTTRTGQVGLMALLIDIDTKGTASDADDTSTLIGWAYRGGITVAAGVDQTAVDLTMVDAATATSVNFGSPPAGLTTVQATLGIETSDGVFQLPLTYTPANAATYHVPSLASVHGTGYRLTAVAVGHGSDSGVVVHGAATGAFAVSGWVAPPTGLSASHTAVSWTAASGTQLTTIEYTQGAAKTKVLDIEVLDGSSHVDLPSLIALPSGALDVEISTGGGAGVDLQNFGLDADKIKLDHVGIATTTAQ